MRSRPVFHPPPQSRPLRRPRSLRHDPRRGDASGGGSRRFRTPMPARHRRLERESAVRTVSGSPRQPHPFPVLTPSLTSRCTTPSSASPASTSSTSGTSTRPPNASPEAAAAAAAHRILTNYFPAQTETLNNDLANVPGRRPGRRAAGQGHRVRRARRRPHHRAPGRRRPQRAGEHSPTPRIRATGSGRRPGSSRSPAPPGSAASRRSPSTPPTRYDPGSPPPINSARYLAEFNEVRRLRRHESTARCGTRT